MSGTVYMWSGAVTEDSTVVAAEIEGGSARVAVADNAGTSGPVYFDATATTDTSFKAAITDLDPDTDTDYWYQVEDEGFLDTSETGKFHTHGTLGEPHSFTFAAASCGGHKPAYPRSTGLAPNRVSNHPVYDSIRQQQPLWFSHMGDMFYYDAGSGVYVPNPSEATYRDGYRAVRACSRQAAPYLSTPIVYSWDDHDYGGNNYNGSFPSKANAATVPRPGAALSARAADRTDLSLVPGRSLMTEPD